MSLTIPITRPYMHYNGIIPRSVHVLGALPQPPIFWRLPLSSTDGSAPRLRLGLGSQLRNRSSPLRNHRFVTSQPLSCTAGCLCQQLQCTLLRICVKCNGEFKLLLATETDTLDLLTAGSKFTQLACRAAPAAIDRYLLPRPTSAANPPTAAAAVDRRDRQTDGRTDGRTLDRFMTHAMRTAL